MTNLFVRNTEHDCDGLKENLDEEMCSKENLTRQLIKTQNESDMWRQKYEVEGIAKAEELEMAKLKLQVSNLILCQPFECKRQKVTQLPLIL